MAGAPASREPGGGTTRTDRERPGPRRNAGREDISIGSLSERQRRAVASLLTRTAAGADAPRSPTSSAGGGLPTSDHNSRASDRDPDNPCVQPSLLDSARGNTQPGGPPAYARSGSYPRMRQSFRCSPTPSHAPTTWLSLGGANARAPGPSSSALLALAPRPKGEEIFSAIDAAAQPPNASVSAASKLALMRTFHKSGLVRPREPTAISGGSSPTRPAVGSRASAGGGLHRLYPVDGCPICSIER